MTSRIAQWVRPEIRALSAYHVPDPGGLIKLDAMENPYSLPEDLVEGWLEALRGVDMNRYPDPGARILKARLRRVMGVPAGQGILLGNINRVYGVSGNSADSSYQYRGHVGFIFE